MAMGTGAGAGLPSTTAPPRTRFCAWQCVMQVVAGGATSVASSPVTQPMRPPLGTFHCEMPPQCRTVATVPSRVRIWFTHCPGGGRTRVAPCGLGSVTKSLLFL